MMGRNRKNDEVVRLFLIVVVLIILAWTFRNQIIVLVANALQSFLTNLINFVISSLPTIIVLVLGLCVYFYLTKNNRLSDDQASVASLILVVLPPFLPQIWIANIFINGYVIIFGLGAVLAIILRYAGEAVSQR